MSSILKVNTIQDGGGNAIITSDGSGNFTTQNILTPSFFTTLTSNQTISDETYTTLQFNNVVFDTNSGYSTSTYKYTIPVAGKYCIYSTARANSPNNSDGLERYYLRLLKNSDVEIAEVYYDQRNNPGFLFSNTIVDIHNLSASDTIYIKAFVDVTNGGDNPQINGTTAGKSITSFGAYRIGS